MSSNYTQLYSEDNIMKVLFFCPMWGSENQSFKDFVRNVKEAGYDGVEMGFPNNPNQKRNFMQILKDHGLLLIGQHFQTGTSDFNEHKMEYEKNLRNLVDTAPLFINSQTGKDFFSFEQNAELIEIANTISDEVGVKIIHETHRGKFSFAVHTTQRYLNYFDTLRLGLDISHWCNVAESLLQDQPEAVALALSRTDHIHARVGFQEGPQIPDPRIPEWKDTVEQHLRWWDNVVEDFKRRNQDFITITPEFGPVPYMQIHPQTKRPLADQWDLNRYMKDFLSLRYRRYATKE
jgi:sugar phosphate isomerase/epimerase